MVEIDRYIVDGVVKRDRIVADIKRCKIGKNEILELDKDSRIAEAYFGIGELEKKDKEIWNSNYLDELSLVAVSESFSKEYLLYLSEVAQYIIEKKLHKENNNKKVKGIVVVIIVIILLFCIIFLFTSKVKKDNAQLSVNSNTIAENTYLYLVKVLG